MFHALGFGVLGFGFLGIAALSALTALAGVAYTVLWVWMIVDGLLRTDAEYPGTHPNRKVLWVIAMVLLHPAAIVYLIAVFLKVKRGSSGTATYAAPPAV